MSYKTDDKETGAIRNFLAEKEDDGKMFSKQLEDAKKGITHNRDFSFAGKTKKQSDQEVSDAAAELRSRIDAKQAAPHAGYVSSSSGSVPKFDTRAKRNPMNDKDKKDKLIEIEKENMILKEKENLLEQEILKMKTKLRRIDNLFHSKHMHSDRIDSRALEQELQDQHDELNTENATIKEKIRKLKVIQRGLSSNQKGLATKNNKYAHVRGKLDNGTKSATTQAHLNLIDELKAQLITNQREISRLQVTHNQMAGSGTSAVSVEKLKNNIMDMQQEIRDTQTQMENMKSEYENKHMLFNQSKEVMQDYERKIVEQQRINEDLKDKNYKLHYQVNQANDYAQELKNLERERDHIERSIQNITTSPFLKKDIGESVAVRIAELDQKIIDKQRALASLQEEETKKKFNLSQAREKLIEINAEKELLFKQRGELHNEYSQGQQEVKETDVVQNLLMLNPEKFAQTIEDMKMGGEDAAPIWANMNFLERGDEPLDDVDMIKKEISKIKHEKSELAAELEKAQNLVKLQKDIEKENTLYFEEEKQRLNLLSKSALSKAQELARRADEKERQIQEINTKMGLTKQGQASPSPVKRYEDLDKADMLSEFSVMTNESDIKLDENILDFKIENAQYNFDSFSQVLDHDQMQEHRRNLITLVTVEFYNHGTETTQLAEGPTPNYQTQLSFKNKIDNFYIINLKRKTIKLDVYISMNNSPIHIGTAQVYLKDLIEREIIAADSGMRTPVIQKYAQVYPIRNANQDQQQVTRPIGSIKYKMRLRKPVSEAMRYFQQMEEMDSLSKQYVAKEQSLKPRRKLVTINIIQCTNLKVSYAQVAQVRPFFYYQFYTEEERYSRTSEDINPQFDDMQSYEVLCDASAQSYFEKEALEVIFFDDNAPISGADTGNQQNEDMIGVARIPLECLANGASLHEKFAIKNIANEIAGYVEAKISLLDLEQDLSQMNAITPSLNYNKSWEEDIINRIAQKLAKVPCEVSLVFGIFSRGSPFVSFEDFKYCVLQRLNLKHELNERELDMFLDLNETLQGHSQIDQEQFVQIFNSAIIHAKHELMNRQAMENSYQNININNDDIYSNQNQQSQRQQELDFGMRTYSQSEVYKILGRMIIEGYYMRVRQEIDNYCNAKGMDEMATETFRSALMRHGYLSQTDATMVAQSISNKNVVSQYHIETMFNAAREHAKSNSEAMRKFNIALEDHGKLICQNLEKQDINKDQMLNIDGLKSAFLIPETKLNNEEMTEIFYLIAKEDQINYVSWFKKDYDSLKLSDYFTLAVAQKIEEQNTHRSHDRSSLGERAELSGTSGNIKITQFEQQKLNMEQLYNSAKNKIENFMISQSISLEVMFGLIDQDSNRRVQLSEFRSKVKKLQMGLNDEEIDALFSRLDMDADRSISLKEFVEHFSRMNTQNQIKKMSKVLTSSKIDPEILFNEFSNRRGQMYKDGFTQFTKKVLSDNLTAQEVMHLFRHFDRGHKSYITKDDFLGAFSTEVTEDAFKIGIEDIIKPLATMIKIHNVNTGLLFEKYDQDKNFRLSAKELGDAFRIDHNIRLTQEEIDTLQEYFKNKYNITQIHKRQFFELMGTQFERKVDESEARSSLSALRQKMQLQNITAKQLLQKYQYEYTKKINIRDFKFAIHSLKALSQYSLDNLTKFLDKRNEGFIALDDFKASVENAMPLDRTMKGSSSGYKSNKWT